MNTPTRTNAEKWRDTVELFELITASCALYKPMLELVRWLAHSPLCAALTAGTSHATLHLVANEVYQTRCPQTSLWISHRGENFVVEYGGFDADGGSWTLKKSYACDQIKTAIEAWVLRLKMEAEVFDLT